MTDNIKQFLHTWCSQNKKLSPTYNIINQGGRGNQRLRFNCEVAVDGFNYTGFGSSTNKKDAQTNAARDFVNYLVRENVIQKESVPEFKKSELVGPNDEIVLNAPLIIQNPGPINSDQSENIQGNYITNIFDQKKLEEAEGADFTADIHGNWSLDNAKARLHQYMQLNKIQAEYKYTSVGPDHNKSFVCEMTIFCNQLKKSLSSREAGSNKQTSSKSCALSLVRQMFHLGVIEAYGGISKKTKSDQIPTFKVSIDPEIKSSLSDVIKNLGLQSKQKPETESNEEINMVVNYTIVDFEPQNHQRAQVIPWSPAMPNWNAWMSCNIDEGEQAFLSLDEISKKLKDTFMQLRLSNEELQGILKEREQLPAAKYEEQIVDAVMHNQIVLIRGETGSGKTTQVPQFIIDYHIQMNKGAECNIIVTQPRRISAITLAERVAQERGEMIGQSCGYSVRFETVYPQPYGSLLYCTVGTLLRKMEAGLRGISHLIVDEIHERDVNTDFLMILLKDMAANYPQLKILLMSATIDIELFTNFFPNIFVLEMEGRTFPVNYYFLEDCIELLNFIPDQQMKKDKKSSTVNFDEENEVTQTGRPDDVDANCNLFCGASYKPQTKVSMSKLSEKEISFELIEALLKYIENIHPDGAVLIFLPGWNIIHLLLKHLSKHSIYGSPRYVLLPLHSQIPRVDQKKVFLPCRPGVRKIILATNIAESSITINDVMFVIDSCRAKVKMFTSRNNMTSYNTVWASKTNLEQRRGRAGRVCEGYTFHLCSRARFERLEMYQTPEILRTALHDLALMIKLLKLGDTKEFLSKALEQPPIDAIIEAEHLLKEMKAFDKNDELTPLGRILARLPIEPRMGKMIIFGCLFGVGDACTIIAACTSLGDPLVIPSERKRLTKAQVDLAGGRCSDHVAILNAFQKWSSIQKRGLSEEDYCESKGLNLSILRMSKDAASQMKSILINTGFPEECLEPQFFDYSNPCPLLDQVINLLVLGLYPNVCYHKDKRKVLTTESKPALVHKSSVNCNNYVNSFPSPFFIFGEKIRTRAISCKQMSMINPLQLLIFGSRKVTYQNQMIVIDDWLSLDMDFEFAAEILALRPALEGLMVKVCMNPDIVMNPDDNDSQIINIVSKLSEPGVCHHGNDNFNPRNAMDDNRKRKPFNQSRTGLNQSYGVPNKFRGVQRSNSNLLGNREAIPVKVPNISPQKSVEEESSNFTSKFPRNQKHFNTNIKSVPFQKPNFNNNKPFIKQTNSSYIKNKFENLGGSQFGSSSDFNDDNYSNNGYYNDNVGYNTPSRPNSSFQNNRPQYLLSSTPYVQPNNFYQNQMDDSYYDEGYGYCDDYSQSSMGNNYGQQSHGSGKYGQQSYGVGKYGRPLSGGENYVQQSSMGGDYGQQSHMGGDYGQQSHMGGDYGQQSHMGGNYGQQSHMGGNYGQQSSTGGNYGQQSSMGGNYGQQSSMGGNYGQQSSMGGNYGQQSSMGGNYGQQSFMGGNYGYQSSFSGNYNQKAPIGGNNINQTNFQGKTQLKPKVDWSYITGKKPTQPAGPQVKQYNELDHDQYENAIENPKSQSRYTTPSRGTVGEKFTYNQKYERNPDSLNPLRNSTEAFEDFQSYNADYPNKSSDQVPSENLTGDVNFENDDGEGGSAIGAGNNNDYIRGQSGYLNGRRAVNFKGRISSGRRL